MQQLPIGVLVLLKPGHRLIGLEQFIGPRGGGGSVQTQPLLALLVLQVQQHLQTPAAFKICAPSRRRKSGVRLEPLHQVEQAAGRQLDPAPRALPQQGGGGALRLATAQRGGCQVTHSLEHLVAVHVQLGELRQQAQLVKGAHRAGHAEPLQGLGQRHVSIAFIVQFKYVPLDEVEGVLQVPLLAGKAVGLQQEGGGVGALVSGRGRGVQVGGHAEGLAPHAHVVRRGVKGVGRDGVEEEAGGGGLGKR